MPPGMFPSCLGRCCRSHWSSVFRRPLCSSYLVSFALLYLPPPCAPPALPASGRQRHISLTAGAGPACWRLVVAHSRCHSCQMSLNTWSPQRLPCHAVTVRASGLACWTLAISPGTNCPILPATVFAMELQQGSGREAISIYPAFLWDRLSQHGQPGTRATATIPIAAAVRGPE